MTDSLLAAGTYEVLRNRLREASNDLRSRFQQLNEARASVFGNVDTRLIATTHASTEHNCIPRDMFANQSHVILGFNVQFGLKTDIAPSDVIALYHFDGEHARSEPLDALLDSRFVRDFQELYKYYRSATFSRFFQLGPYLYMVFQTGKTNNNIKAFKWAIEGSLLHYIDNRSEAEVRLPGQYAFEWKRATRDHHRHGKHPHISIEDIVFVECVHGDLTIKIEDNTEDGLGIYREPVTSPDQTLDDAETFYAVLGDLVLLKIRPYQERDFRYLVFSTKRSKVYRLDSIGQACVLLPDDHGIIFPGGFVLQTGEVRLFDHGLNHLTFDRTVKAPNGEDFLYLFGHAESGTYLHLRYNLIRQEVDTPLSCHGQAFFENGRMLCMRAGDVPQKHHAIQIWQTPFTGPNHVPAVKSDSLLFKIGNRDLVRGMAGCQELLSLVDKDESYADLYSDLVKRSTNLLDGHFWLDREETFNLAAAVNAIRDTAAATVDEFEKVVRVRRETQSATEQCDGTIGELLKAIERSRFEKVEDFVDKLASLRRQRGEAIQLRELRYIDLDRVAAMEARLSEAADRVGVRCLQFLLEPQSLTNYIQQIDALSSQVPRIDATAPAKKTELQLSEIGGSLELLIETVSQLKIEDLAQRTQIIDRIGDCMANLNRVRSTLKMRIRDLTTREMESDFASQSKLLDQATASALDTADRLEKVDTALTRILLQIEELEGRYADSEELLLRLADKRQSLCDLFEARRQQLVESQNRRANSLVSAADRMLTGIASRANRIDAPAELMAYFAADLMVDKVRKIADQLGDLGDSVRRDDVLSRLRTISDDALRQQRDRRDLQTDGNRKIRLGHHTFSVNQQAVELTTVVRGDQLCLHVTGTQFYQPLEDAVLEEARDLWDQPLPSESPEVYRGETLAYTLSKELSHVRSPRSADRTTEVGSIASEDFLRFDVPNQIAWVRERMQKRLSEGYVRGVHDHDGAIILRALLELQRSLGLLAHAPKLRALSVFAWQNLIPEIERSACERWVKSVAAVDQLLPNSAPSSECHARVSRLLRDHAATFLAELPCEQAAEYLIGEFRSGSSSFVVSPNAYKLLSLFEQHVPQESRQAFANLLSAHQSQPLEAWVVAMKAANAFLEAHVSSAPTEAVDPWSNYREELGRLLRDGVAANALTIASAPKAARVGVTVHGLVGDHPRIVNHSLGLNYHEYIERLSRYMAMVVPRWQALQATKRSLIEKADRRFRSHEFKAKVLTSFVRNQLIDEVYLPRVGENLAKQIGASGENKRTDRMGLLLLISPPGYGKTTLMEYIANRLGLVFVKVNGPAIGHEVTSLDPSEATHASAREEIHRINMALEMGDNTMLYLDDIQHCHVELLQKFIPLCDATRRIEGVWNGQPRSYDLRGRKFAVVMAGNPYTESGHRFQVPDMLANRADVYNLGEIVGDSREAFEQSYLENCLTSNPILQPLARCPNADQRKLIEASLRGTTTGIELESNLTADTVSEMLSVLSKLQRVRDIVLQVNQEYIRSAAQSDDYRTEPPFKLQGSYRNMNRIAEKVVPVMNEQELELLILSSYQQDSQTLSRDSESNMLKFRELLGIQSAEEAERWRAIKQTFAENNRLKGLSDEGSTAQFLSSLLGLRDGLEAIRAAVESAAKHPSENALPPKVQPPFQLEPKIIVQHSVPRVMTDLIRSQFQLLYDGLRPVLESHTKQSLSSDRLRATIEDLLTRYRAMEEAVTNAPESDDVEFAQPLTDSQNHNHPKT